MGEIPVVPMVALSRGTMSVSASATAASSPAPPPFNLPPGGLFANPYGEEFYLYVTTDATSGVSTVNIISGLDTLYLTQDASVPAGSVYVPPEENLVVWADSVTISGAISLPGRSVTLWAQTLQWQPDAGAVAPRIDVSGTAPAPPPVAALKSGPAGTGSAAGQYTDGGPGSPGNPGADGNSAADSGSGVAFTPATGTGAGTITIYAGNLSDTLAPGTVLTLAAIGGAGQNGQDAQWGQDGGTGGSGYPPEDDSVHVEGWPVWPQTEPRGGGNGGAGGTGGNGGPGATGGTGGTIVIGAFSATSTTSISCVVDGGPGGTGGAGGQGGNGGDAGYTPQNADSSPTGGMGGFGQNGGTGGIGGAAGTIQSLVFTDFNPTTSANGGAGGNGGSAGGPGNPGNPNGNGASGGSTPGQSAGGASGSVSPLPSYGTFTLALNCSSLQCSMMLQKGNLHYLSADPVDNPAGFDAAAVVYNWLQKITEPIVQWQSSGTTPPGYSFTEQDTTILVDTYSQARAAAARLALRLDYFGNPFSYVPRVAYSVQQTLLGQMIADFAALETQYQSYFSTLQQSQSSYEQVVAQASATSAQVASTNQQIIALQTSAAALVTTLDQQLAELEAAITVMDQKIEAYQSDLEEAAAENGCANATIDIMKFVCQTFTGAVTGNAAGFVARIAGKATDAALEAQMTDAGKALGNDNDVIAKVQVLLADISSLAQIYENDPNDVTSGTYKLIAADESALQEMISKYTNVLPDNADGKAALDSIKHFLNVAQQRNQNVMLYNTDLANYISLNATLAKLQAQLNDVNNLPTNVDPGLPWIVAFMAQLYHTVRGAILYQLYLTGRALGYWSLQPALSALSVFVDVSDPAAITSGTLSGANSRLLSAFNSALESFGSGSLGLFPAKGQNTGIVVPFTAAGSPAIFAALLSKTPCSTNQAGYVYTVSVPVPVVTASTPAADSPFASWANVRISTARPWIDGVTTTSGNLSVDITHDGAEAICGEEQGQQCWFTHQPTTATFEFVIATKAILRDANGFGTVTNGSGGYYSDADYAPPGPFALWTITIDPDQNPGLDVSGMSALNIEFQGGGYSFPADGQQP